MLIVIIMMVMVIVTVSFEWELFLDVQLIQSGFFCGSSCSTSHSFFVPAASYLESKCQGVCSHTSRRRGGNHTGRKLEMRPEYSGTDLYQRVSKVHRQVSWLPRRPSQLMLSLLIISLPS